MQRQKLVAPRRGAWIEIMNWKPDPGMSGAWIEMQLRNMFVAPIGCCPLRGIGLRFTPTGLCAGDGNNPFPCVQISKNHPFRCIGLV